MKKPVVRLMFDSGAFSAWTKGSTIDVKDYIAFVKEHRELMDTIVGLDVIPGQLGRKRTSTDVEASAAASYKQNQIMKDAGVIPMPVFHRGEDFKWLERMLKDGETYIGLGVQAASGITGGHIRRWLDDCFSLICRDGVPQIRTHGFGATQPALMLRYPWTTCDSTTWFKSPAYGLLYVPPMAPDGGFDWARRPIIIIISGVYQGPSAAPRQFESLGPETQRYVERYLGEVAGCTLAEARYSFRVRWKCGIIYYRELTRHYERPTFGHHTAGLLTSFERVHGKAKAITDTPFRCIFANELGNRNMATLLDECEIRDILLSYWSVREKPLEMFLEYVRTGTLENPAAHKPLKTNWKQTKYRTFRRLKLWDRVNEQASLKEDEHVEEV